MNLFILNSFGSSDKRQDRRLFPGRQISFRMSHPRFGLSLNMANSPGWSEAKTEGRAQSKRAFPGSRYVPRNNGLD